MRGDAPPPPFVPRAGGPAAASGPRGGCAWPQGRTQPPPLPVPGAGLARALRSPTRARNPARGPAAAAHMPGAGERLQRVTGSERKRPPTRGRGGGGGGSRSRAMGRVGSRGRLVRRWRASSRSPGSPVSWPFAAETRVALARWPLAALPPPLAKRSQGTSRNSQFLESWRRPVSFGWVRVGFGRRREQRGKLRNPLREVLGTGRGGPPRPAPPSPMG